MILKSLMVCVLLLAVVWDADGNPSTDNLPSAVRCEGVETAERSFEADEDVGGETLENDVPTHRPLSPRRCRRFWRASRETTRRSIAVPERGP